MPARRATAPSTVSPPVLTRSSSRRTLSRSTGLPSRARDEVRAARLKAREVEGDIDVADLAEPFHDRLVTTLLPEERHLLTRDLEARQPVVVAHPELAESEGADELLGRVHLPELLRGDRVAVLEARREARERGFVPGRQPERLRQLADLRLPELRLDHRRADAHLACGPHSRPVIAEVVHVGAVDQRGTPLAQGDGPEPREELLLAEEAALRGIGRVRRVGELLGPDDHMPQPEQLAEPLRLRQLTGRVRLRVRGDEHGAVAERVLGRARE